MSGCNALGGIASVYDQLRLLHDVGEIILGVVGDDYHAVEFGYSFQWRAGHIELIFAPMADRGKKRIVVFDVSTQLLQQFDNGQRWRLSQVVVVALVGNSKHQDA